MAIWEDEIKIRETSHQMRMQHLFLELADRCE